MLLLDVIEGVCTYIVCMVKSTRLVQGSSGCCQGDPNTTQFKPNNHIHAGKTSGRWLLLAGNYNGNYFRNANLR